MVLLKARLNAWGESLRVTQPGQEHPVLRDRWIQERETVGMSLFGIKTTFDDAGNLEKKYGLEQSSTESVAPPVYRQIAEKMEFAIASRQKDASFGKKIIWAIHDKKKFDALISDVAFFVDGLEKLSDRLHLLGLQTQLLGTKIQGVTNKESIALLEQASAQPDRLVAPSADASAGGAAPAGSTLGHSYIRTVIKGRARVLNGDLGLQGQSSSYHSFEDTQAFDDAKVVQGNMSAEAARDFFK